MKNANLHAAKVNKNDEFYTQLSDIEKELKNYSYFSKTKLFIVTVMIVLKVTFSNILRSISINLV